MLHQLAITAQRDPLPMMGRRAQPDTTAWVVLWTEPRARPLLATFATSGPHHHWARAARRRVSSLGFASNPHSGQPHSSIEADESGETCHFFTFAYSSFVQGYYCAGQDEGKSPCQAQPGSYCPATTAGVASPEKGVSCSQGVYCLGGQADQQPCAAAAGWFAPSFSHILCYKR